MEQLKNLYKFFVLICSEVIWLYYFTVMFISLEWDQLTFFDFTWLMVAAVLGYVLNLLLIKMGNHIILFLVNIIVLGILIRQNWGNIVPEGAWGFGIWTSIMICFIFIRSARLVYRQITRQDILRRFEGNILFYVVFVLIFTGNKWVNNSLHLVFILAILSSLLGMILTLQNYEEDEVNKTTKVMKVGESGWFVGAITILLMAIFIFSLLLLLPVINRGLYTFVMNIWQGLLWVGFKIAAFVGWLFSLFPDTEMEVIPSPPPEEAIMIHSAGGEAVSAFPYIWLIVGIVIVLVGGAIWILTKLISYRKIPRTLKFKKITVIKESWWSRLKRRLIAFLKYIKRKWYMSFACFYYEPIYWYYYQVVKWGRRNNLPKLKTETSQEYITRIMAEIPAEKNCFNHKEKTYRLSELLMRLSKDYQATYYGCKKKINAELEYKLLINHLQRIGTSKNFFKQAPTFKYHRGY